MISWLTMIMSAVDAQRGRHSSGVYLPFIGPVLIDIWLVRTGAPQWTLLLPWIADIGTVLFLIALPRLVQERWRFSRFTRLYSFVGSDGNQSATIAFHRGGHYFLQKRWHRSDNGAVVMMCEAGRFSGHEAVLRLASAAGRERYVMAEGDVHVVSDAVHSDNMQLHQWRLHKSAR